LVVVARQVPCALSLLSYVESGHRALQPWLAEALDRIYRTGSVVASLARRSGGTLQDNSASGVPGTDVFVVLLPQGGVTMPLSRREVLTALGLGIASGGLQGEFERALDAIELDGDVLQSLQDAFHGFKEAARILPPHQLIDGMMGNVAILDGLRRRATAGTPSKIQLAWESLVTAIGDQVEIEDQTGVVEEIGLTYTFIRLDDNDRLVIPNERIASDTIRNSMIVSREKVAEITLQVPLDKDLRKVVELLRELGVA